MMELRPIVIDASGMILGGNMRFKAIQHIGMKEIPDTWVRSADSLTPDEQRRFIIADNVSGGDWDVEDLAANWDKDELSEWGVELEWPSEQDYSYKNKEINTDLFDDEMIIKLKYTESEYLQVKEQLSKIAETPEQAVWKLLGND